MKNDQPVAYTLPERMEVRVESDGNTITIWQFAYEQDDSIIKLSLPDAIIVAGWLLSLAQEKT